MIEVDKLKLAFMKQKQLYEQQEEDIRLKEKQAIMILDDVLEESYYYLNRNKPL